MHIQAKNLKKSFGAKQAVKGISLDVTPGKILGLLGPNGAGKSTTIKMLSGQLAPDEGELIIDDKTYTEVPTKLRGKIGVMPQELIVWDDLNIRENLEFTAKLQGMKSNVAKKQVEYLIEALHLERELKTLARDLSGGYKRRLNLAISIIHKPSLVFLDEPTPGIDAQSRRFLMDFIAELGDSQNYSVVLTDHYLDEAEKLSDYVVIIDAGEVIAEGTVPQLKQQHGSGNLVVIDLDEESGKDREQVKALANKLSEHLESVQTKKQSITALAADPVKAIQASLDALNQFKLKAINVSIKEPSLEDIFLILTGKEIRE